MPMRHVPQLHILLSFVYLFRPSTPIKTLCNWALQSSRLLRDELRDPVVDMGESRHDRQQSGQVSEQADRQADRQASGMKEREKGEGENVGTSHVAAAGQYGYTGPPSSAIPAPVVSHD